MSEEIALQEPTYFEQRMAELGIDPERYLAYQPGLRPEDKPTPHRLFEPAEGGAIRINYLTCTGGPATYQVKDVKHPKHFFQIRQLPGTLNAKGEELRYTIPRGAGTKPWIPPGLIAKYNAQTPVPVLVLTEGAFKAAKGDTYGLDIIGLPSITHAKNQDKELHTDIKRIIDVCKVQSVVWLHDGDARRLTIKWPAEDEFADLYKRPNQFYSTIWTIKTLFNDFVGMRIYYACIKSEAVAGDPKGLDDWYLQIEQNFPTQVSRFVEELHEEFALSSTNCRWIDKFDVSTGMEDVRKWFRIDSVTSFYNHHQGKIGEREFVYNGTTYRWNGEKALVEVMIPKETSDYVRIGTDYYKWIMRPTPQGDDERVLVRWSLPTIKEDHGPNFAKHVNKLNDFCNVPDHANYQLIISGCYNIYQPFKWTEREDGSWDTIKGFLVHIFGTETVTYKDSRSGEIRTVTELDLGLDYLQLLYLKPTQKLPILCLVSKEKETGKSTFGVLVKAIFGQNATWVGNSDLSNDFNSSWSTKLAIMCDEVLIDKKLVMEKIKALATGDKIMMNAKGKDQKEMDFYGKFIFTSNNENSFINTDEEETRFWVRKIRRLTAEELNPDLPREMEAEIPAFLNYLDHRKMATARSTRGWFQTNVTKTEALKRVVEHSRPTVEKEIRERMQQLFEVCQGREEILMAASDVQKEFFRSNKYELRYLRESIENMGVEPLMVDGVKVAKRYRYPVVVEYFDNEKMVNRVKLGEKDSVGKPFVFKRDMFVLEELKYEDLREDGDVYVAEGVKAVQAQLDLLPPDKDDLPF